MEGTPNETGNEFVICGARVAYLMMLDCDLIADKLAKASPARLMSNISFCVAAAFECKFELRRENFGACG